VEGPSAGRGPSVASKEKVKRAKRKSRESKEKVKRAKRKSRESKEKVKREQRESQERAKRKSRESKEKGRGPSVASKEKVGDGAEVCARGGLPEGGAQRAGAGGVGGKRVR